MIIAIILLELLIAEIVIIFLWKSKGIRKMRITMQTETDLRLTYKRYKELYPNSNLSYIEYKQLQARRAYKKAVSSTKIKRMVR